MADIEVKARGSSRDPTVSLLDRFRRNLAKISARTDANVPNPAACRVLLRLLGLETFGQYAVQRVDVEVGRLDVNAQRRLGLQDVHVVTGGLDDHPELEHAVADRRRLFRRGFQGL